MMIYGTNLFSPINSGTNSFSRYTLCRTQLGLFSIAPKFITNRKNYWLRDPMSDAGCARVGGSGVADRSAVTQKIGVRPVFSICAAL